MRQNRREDGNRQRGFTHSEIVRLGGYSVRRAFGAILALAMELAGAALAHGQQRGQTQGDWPCRQIKVPSVSLASVWTGPPIDVAAKAWRDDALVSDLVARISARRTSIEDARKSVLDFAKAGGEKRNERLTTLFAGVYDRLDSERSEVLGGLDRYGRKQKELAEKLRAEAQSLREEQNKTPADAQKIKELSEALQWDLRIFDERRNTLAYVCETPALIEQRLGALARAIAAAME